jgi:GNAT superfamily N-acetyltransferase
VEQRGAGVGDLDLLVRLRLEYIRADLGEPDQDQEAVIVAQLRSWIPANLGERFFAWLAFVDGEPAGVAMLAVNEYPANPGFPNGRVGTVLNVWTRPAHRGRGIATGLMEELIGVAEELGLSRLELRSSMLARPLYERVGFVPAPEAHLPMQLDAPGRRAGSQD